MDDAFGDLLGAVQGIAVGVDDARNLASAQAEIEGLLRQRHKINPGEEDDFNVRNLTSLMETMTIIILIEQCFLICIWIQCTHIII